MVARASGASLPEQLALVLGSAVMDLRPLSGGCVAEAWKARLADGRLVAVKQDDPTRSTLPLEGWMLRYLRQRSPVPVPEVYHAGPGLLVMAYIDHDGGNFDAITQRHCAEVIAACHATRWDRFGLERDTLIGALPQPNPPSDRWLPFFREQRLLHMAREALKERRIPAGLMARLERLADRLDRYIDEPEYPSLLHGDLWGGNILTRNGRLVGLIDPAVYYGHPEIELAFSTLFNTFGKPFFDAYAAIRGLSKDFFALRRDLYNLYPLLVHVRLFGSSYLGSIESILARLGC
ncbi:MAG TPA: fructosamine kinase family protein [Candidatus Hydrogenedentes bacterium]|nr:fructosamine kinase family protein [Candidatus Hydrogenedentota bacterium]